MPKYKTTAIICEHCRKSLTAVGSRPYSTHTTNGTIGYCKEDEEKKCMLGEADATQIK